MTTRLQGHADVRAQILDHGADMGWELHINFSPDDGAGDFCDGDVIVVTVTDLEDDRVIIDTRQAVTYTSDSPNGAFCGPTCDGAWVDLSPP